jgi:hypothetical protein
MKLFYHWVNVTIIIIISGLLGMAIGLMCGCDFDSSIEGTYTVNADVDVLIEYVDIHSGQWVSVEATAAQLPWSLEYEIGRDDGDQVYHGVRAETKDGTPHQLNVSDETDGRTYGGWWETRDEWTIASYWCASNSCVPATITVEGL